MDLSKYTKDESEIGPVDPSDWYAYTIKTGSSQGRTFQNHFVMSHRTHMGLHRIHQKIYTSHT